MFSAGCLLTSLVWLFLGKIYPPRSLSSGDFNKETTGEKHWWKSLRPWGLVKAIEQPRRGDNGQVMMVGEVT